MDKITKRTTYSFSNNAPKTAWALIREEEQRYVLLYKNGSFEVSFHVNREEFNNIAEEFHLTLDEYYYEFGAIAYSSMLRITHQLSDCVMK